MSRIDDIAKQIRQAQAQAIRNAPSDTVISPDKVEEESKRILRDSIAKQQTELAITPQQYSASEQDTRTTQQKYEEAQKAYEDYTASSAYRQGIAANQQNALQQAMDMMFAGGQDLPANLTRPVIQEDAKAKELEAAANYYKNQMQAEEDRKVMDSDLLTLDNMSDDERQALQLYATNRNRDLNAPIELTTSPFYKTAEQEAATLISKYGKQKVDQLAESYMRSENQKVSEAVTKAAQEGAGGSLLGAVGHSAASVGANLVGSMTGPLGYLQEAATGTGRYSTLDPNNAGNLLNTYAGAVRQEVAQNIEGDEGSTGRQLLSYGYQGVMSAADSIARALAFGKGSLGLAAMGSFSQTMSEASRQGATPEQAAILAAGSAALEVATEYIPLDEMLKAAKGGAKGAMQVAGEALKQAGIEAATEEISLFGNLLLEAAVLQENSSYKQQIGEAVAHGASYEDAKKQANQAVWNEALQTAFVSGFSGAASGGGSALVGSVAGQTIPLTEEQTKVETAVATEQAAPQPAQLPQTPKEVNAFIMEDMGQKMAQTAPKTEPVEMTEGERQAKQAADEVFGAQPLEQQKNTAQTGGENDGLRPYTQHEKDNWKSSKRIVLFEGVEQFRQFIRNALSGNAQTNKKMYFGAVTNKLASKIANATGLNVEGYNLSLGENEIRKIKTSHGNEKKEQLRGQRAVTEDDYLNIPNVIQNADVISRSDSDYGGKPAIEFYKKNGNEVTAVVAVVSDKHLDIFVQTSYINKKTGSIATPESVQADSFTSETPGGTAPTNNIPEGVAGVKGVGAAEANFSGKPTYYATLGEDNAQADRMTDVRPMELPERDASGNNISAVTGNVYGSRNTPDDLASAMEEPTAKGDFSYISVTNDEATQRALAAIENAGSWQNARIEWRDDVNRGIAGAEISARGALILNHTAEVYQQAKESGDTVAAESAKKEWLSVLSDLQKMGTNTAQGLQALRIIRNLMPVDKLEFAKAAVRNMVRDMQLNTDIEIDETLLDEYEQANTDEERDAIMLDIQQNVADQIPSTILDKWNALRYMNMLGNLKTPGRNTLGNVMNATAYRIKDAAAASIEAIANAATRGRTGRTKSAFVNRSLQKACGEYYQQVKAAIGSGGKYRDNQAAGDNFTQDVLDRRRIFKSNARNETVRQISNVLMAPAEGYRRATNWMMNNQYFGDEAFGKAAFTHAMAGYLQANGIKTVSDLQKADNALMDKAVAYAVKEAQETTFHDNSALANTLGKLKKDAGIVGEGLIPFTKTPANVLTRAEEFSPLGFINTAVLSAQKAAGNSRLADRSGKVSDWARAGRNVTGTDIVNSMAKGMTGSMLFAIGAAMFDQGLLSGGPDDDEEQAAFDSMYGHQDYAITLPDGTSYTIDWATPIAMPMFMGAQFWKLLREKESLSDLTFADLEQVFTSIADPMIQMSMLQGMNDSLNNIRYAENNLGQFLINSSVSYLTQGVTNTLMGQLERSTEENRMTTYIDKESNIPDWMQRAVGKASQKLPGWDYQQMEYRNAFGETEENEGGLLYNLLSPGYISKEKDDVLYRELTRIRKETGENAFPQTPEKSMNYTDKNGNRHEAYQLSMQELETLQKTQGQTAKRLLTQIIESPDYKSMTDAQKAATVAAVYEYAREAGKKAALPDYYSTAAAWMGSLEGNEVNGLIKRGTEKVLNSIIDDAVQSISRGWEVTEATKKGMDNSYAAFENMSEEAQQAVRENADGDTARFLEVRGNGISTEAFVQAVANIKSAKSAKNADKWEAIAKTTGMTPEEIDIVMKAYMADYDPEDESPDKTELKYDYAREEMGLTSSDYARAYRVHADNSKKDDRVKAWQEMGYRYEEANILYKLFSGKLDVEKWYNEQ